jgi:arylsulfatase A-like enzyme
VAETISRAGYRTGLVGKWHLSGQLQNPASFLDPILLGGFDGHLGSMENLHGPDAYFQWEKNVAAGAGSTQQLVTHYATSENVDDALALIDGWRTAPWFLLLAFNASHAPFHVPPDGLHSLPVSPDSSKPLLFRADVEALDTELGRLLAGIPPAVLARTTIIVMGDNGTPASVMTPPMVPGHMKGTVYEGGIRVPLIVAGHRVSAPGRQVRALVHVVDLFETLVDLTGAPDPGTGIDSISLLPLLLDPDAPATRPWIYSETFYPNGLGPYLTYDRAVSDGRFKLIKQKGSPAEFYDLDLDPLELQNLLPDLDAEQQAAHDRLAALLDSLHD